MTRLPRLYAPVTVGRTRGGTPLTLDRAFHVADQLERASDRLADRYQAAYTRWMRARTVAAKGRAHARAQSLRDEWNHAQAGLDRLYNQLDAYGNALTVREEATAVAKAERRPEPAARELVEEEDAQAEWQFGLEYEARHRGSNVDLNVNIRRRDGRKMTRTEAVDAFQEYLRYREAPAGYEVASIVYRSPESKRAAARTFGSRGHAVEDLQLSFDSVIANTDLADWRVGGIE